jgi:hypothetical protein
LGEFTIIGLLENLISAKGTSFLCRLPFRLLCLLCRGLLASEL